MASHTQYHEPQRASTVRVTNFNDLDPWYTCMYPDYSDTPAPSNRGSVSSAYSSPPALSLTTNLLNVNASYTYSAHPDSGIQVTPHTATTLSTPKFGSTPSSAGGIGMPRSGTPGGTNSPIPMLAASYASSVSDATEAWEAHQSMRQSQPIQSHRIERAATFDASDWRIPAYPDVNIVQPTPVNANSSHQWPEPGTVTLKHRNTGISDAAISGRDNRSASRENKRVRLSPFSGSECSSSEDETASQHAPVYSNSSSPQLSKSAPTPGHLNVEYGTQPKARKGRRKLGAAERKEVHELRKMGACTRCWGLKMKCGEGSPCPRCLKLGGSHQCVRVHFVDLDVFSKWLNDTYSRSMMHNVLRWSPASPRTITISHENNGISLPVRCHEFIPVLADQLDYWYKDAYGWQSVPTTPFAMKKGVSADILDKYIDDHVGWYVENHFKGVNPIFDETFKIALKYANSNPKDNAIVRDTLKLWTTHQLLLKGATIVGEETLRMTPVACPTSSINGKVPLPRVLSNQLDHLLERRIWQAERQLLSELQRRILSRKREEWLRVYFCLFIFMNTLERDTWRLYYWYFHAQDGYIWRHPLSPSQLIEKNIRLADSLAAHFQAISKGLTPFALDWTREQTLTLVSQDEEILRYIESTGKLVRDQENIRKRRNVLAGYNEADERSLDFLCSGKILII
ncbi:hypothetical protein BDZ91DRAFT_792025 [Kalaharituber pfeilii]|nr:hypothetical protein BDZ91DRAFT_792025 [Kalaharituber pfeilii]